MIEPIFRGGLFCASQVYADVMEHHSMSLAQMKSYVAQLAVRSNPTGLRPAGPMVKMLPLRAGPLSA